MISYRDMTFCPYYRDCARGPACERPLTADVSEEAESVGLPVAKFAEPPECYTGPVQDPEPVTHAAAEPDDDDDDYDEDEDEEVQEAIRGDSYHGCSNCSQKGDCGTCKSTAYTDTDTPSNWTPKPEGDSIYACQNCLHSDESVLGEPCEDCGRIVGSVADKWEPRPKVVWDATLKDCRNCTCWDDCYNGNRETARLSTDPDEIAGFGVGPCIDFELEVF